MLISSLRAAVIALFGVVGISSAYANGMAEDSRALLSGQVKEAFEDTIEYLGARNTRDGKPAIELLYGRVQQLQAGVLALHGAATALSPSLGETWKPTLSAVDALLSATQVVRDKVGRGTLDLSYMKSSYDAANSELEKAYAVSQDFGRAYIATFNLVDNAKAMYGDGVTSAYTAAVRYLNEENDIDGKPAMEKLTSIANALVSLSQLIKDGAEDVSPQFLELWMKPTYYDINLLAIEAGYLVGQIGGGSVSLDKLEDAYEDSGSGIANSHAAMKTFGETFTKICDSCR